MPSTSKSFAAVSYSVLVIVLGGCSTSPVASREPTKTEEGIHTDKVVQAFEHGAESCLKSKDYAGAIKNYDAAISVDPRRASEYIKRGTVYFDIGDFKHAALDGAGALNLSPASVEAHLLHGSSHEKLGDWNMAIADLNAVILARPELTEAYVIRGSPRTA